MKLIGAQFRTSLAREAALQNQLDRQAQTAADREEVRNFEESGISKFVLTQTSPSGPSTRLWYPTCMRILSVSFTLNFR